MSKRIACQVKMILHDLICGIHEVSGALPLFPKLKRRWAGHAEPRKSEDGSFFGMSRILENLFKGLIFWDLNLTGAL
jgi:hypothetical protein